MGKNPGRSFSYWCILPTFDVSTHVQSLFWPINTPKTQVPTHNFKTYWSSIQKINRLPKRYWLYSRRCAKETSKKTPKIHRFNVGHWKLTDNEITRLIKRYKNNFEYKFIQRKHTAYGNHIIESFQASYEILRPILKKKDVCYANTIKHLKKLDKYHRKWVKSFDDIHVYDRKEEFQWDNIRTIRSYASEFNLRLRTLWL